VSIRQRPDTINTRAEFGHWDGDTVIGDKHKTGIHTEVERLSRMLFAEQIPRIRAKETYLAQMCIFSLLPWKTRQTTTADNGSEHMLHTKLKDDLSMQTYFADPYCSWQRGTNEYTDNLLRRYFPKRTDFRYVTQKELNAVVQQINNIPRKILNYKTPREVFNEHCFGCFSPLRDKYHSTHSPDKLSQRKNRQKLVKPHFEIKKCSD